MRKIWEKYYQDSHAIVFVVDSTDRARIEECKQCLGNPGFNTDGLIQNEITHGIPVLMLANKQDVVGCLKLHEIKEIFNKIAVKLEARDSTVLAVSAITGDGIAEAIQWIHSRILGNKNERPPTFV